jgi:uncharacterized glyoxalase superfamily protein PhnB
MTDPFNVLQHTDVAAPVDAAFAARLGERLHRALAEPEERTMTDVDAWPEIVPDSQVPRHTLSPYLALPDARRAIGWYAAVFGARLAGPPYEDGGMITHAGLVIGDSLLMFSEQSAVEQYVAGESGQTVSPSGDTLSITVADVDATLQRAAANGADITRPPRDEPYGRTGAMVDPFGRRWLVQQASPG